MRHLKRVLYADDDTDSCELFQAALQPIEAFTYEVVLAQTVTEVITLIQQQRFDLVILEQFYADGKGTGLCSFIQAVPDPPTIIFYTSDVREETRETAMQVGAKSFLTKPNDFEKLLESTEALFLASC